MLEQYVSNLEKEGYIVHLPNRDTNQNARGFDICRENCVAIINADEIHIFYNGKSQGTQFDMGMAFMFNFLSEVLYNTVDEKKLVVVENETYGEGKCYARMLDEWAGNI